MRSAHIPWRNATISTLISCAALANVAATASAQDATSPPPAPKIVSISTVTVGSPKEALDNERPRRALDLI